MTSSSMSSAVRGIVVAAMVVAGIGIAAGPAIAAVPAAPSACVGPQGSGGDVHLTDPCY